MSVKKIDVVRIKVRTDARPVDTAHVEGLANLIKSEGFTSPITVRLIGSASDGHYEVINGQHRLCAVRDKMGAKTIECVVVDLNDLHAELMMHEDNLMHNKLSPVWEAIAFGRGVVLYQEIFPDTRQHVAGGKKRQGTAASDILSFAEWTAKRLGKDVNYVYRGLAVFKALSSKDLVRISGTCLDRKSELALLIGLTPDGREAAIQKAVGGEKFTLRAAALANRKTDTKASMAAEPASDGSPSGRADRGPPEPPVTEAGDQDGDHSADDGDRDAQQRTDPQASGPDGAPSPAAGPEQAGEESEPRAAAEDGDASPEAETGRSNNGGEQNGGAVVDVPLRPSDELPSRSKIKCVEYLVEELAKPKLSERHLYEECLHDVRQDKFDEDAVASCLDDFGKYLADRTIKRMRARAKEATTAQVLDQVS